MRNNQVNLVLNQQCLSLKLNLLLTPRHLTFVMYTFPHSGLVKISDCFFLRYSMCKSLLQVPINEIMNADIFCLSMKNYIFCCQNTRFVVILQNSWHILLLLKTFQNILTIYDLATNSASVVEKFHNLLFLELHGIALLTR